MKEYPYILPNSLHINSKYANTEGIAMDEERYLIIVKNKDRTSEIASYEQLGVNIRLIYRSSNKPYYYNASDVMILDKPVITAITKEQVVFHRDNPLSNVMRVLDFGSRIRVFLRMEPIGCMKPCMFESRAAE